tara:strand:- start:6628 stop:7596 length:969 start_codon:yes stop_codon:yes gene_type:complete
MSSPCNISTTFQHVSQVGNTLLNSELESNLKSFLDWGFLGIGGWFNVEVPTSGAWGGTYDRMRVVNDPAYTLGQVWETPRKDWVWETGVPYTGGSPIQISGVYVNSTLKGTGDATYGHHYNYPLGRVVFDSAIPTTSTVQIEHSYRNVQVYIADQAPWWDELQYNSMRVDDSTFDQVSSGNWAILSNHRVQMPAVVIETVPKRTFQPYELGSSNNFVTQDVLFHIVAESRWWRNQLVDMISIQKDKTLMLYDSDKLADSGAFPLDYRGSVVNSGNNYSGIVNTTAYQYTTARIINMAVTEMDSYNSRLYEGTVRASFELIFA